MKLKTVFFGLILSVTGLIAQVPVDNKKFIEVTGTSETEITPDIIYLNIKLVERMEGKEKVTIEKQEADLKKGLKDIGIDLSNLTLNSADVDFRSIRRKTKDAMVSKSYLLKISSTETLNKVYFKLDEINANDAYVMRYTHTKILDIQKENRIKAIKAAKEKAEYLLAAIDQKAGQALQVTEIDNYVEDMPNRPGMYKAMAQNTMSYNYDSAGADESIAFKSIKVRASYLVKYEIVSK